MTKHRNKKINSVKICIKCGITLNDDNCCRPPLKSTYHYSCRSCDNKKQKENHRIRYVGSIRNGKNVFFTGNKRKHTFICELCNKERKRTVYHHWDDSDISKGLWLCSTCHRFAEMVDKGFVQKYHLLVKNINLSAENSVEIFK